VPDLFWGNDPGRQERPADRSKSRAEYPSDENRERWVHSGCKRKAERGRSAAPATCRSPLVANDLLPYHRLRHRTTRQSLNFTRLQDSSLRWWGPVSAQTQITYSCQSGGKTLSPKLRNSSTQKYSSSRLERDPRFHPFTRRSNLRNQTFCSNYFARLLKVTAP